MENDSLINLTLLRAIHKESVRMNKQQKSLDWAENVILKKVSCEIIWLLHWM